MYILNQSEIVIMFPSGAGIEIVENKGFMSARVYLPWNFMVSLFVNKDKVLPNVIKVYLKSLVAMLYIHINIHTNKSLLV